MNKQHISISIALHHTFYSEGKDIRLGRYEDEVSIVVDNKVKAYINVNGITTYIS